MIKLREPYPARIILIVALSIGLVMLGGLYVKTGNAAEGNEEAAVRDVLMKSALSFEKTIWRWLRESGPTMNADRLWRADMRTMAGRIIVIIIWFPRWGDEEHDVYVPATSKFISPERLPGQL